MAKKADEITYESRPGTEKGATMIDQVWLKQHFALGYMGTGAGKTFMSIHAVGKIADHINLVVVTTKQMVKNQYWKKSIDAYNKATNHHLAYTILNYDILTYKKHRQKLINRIKKFQNPGVLILDEAHKIANPTGKRFNVIKKINTMPQIYRTIALTATALRNNLLDACSYLILAGFYKDKSQFYSIHVKKYDYFNNPVVTNKKGQQDLSLLNHPEWIINGLKIITVTIDTKKYMPKTYRYDYVIQYNPKTQAEYNQIRIDYKNGMYPSPQKAIMAQQEFVAQHSQQQQQIMKQIIENPKRPQTPILIFYQYNAELDVLQNFVDNNFPDYDLICINGHDHKKKLIKPKHNNTIFLIQYASGAEGSNAKWSSLSIFFAPSLGRTAYRQSIGRNIRAYQKGTTFQFRFVVKDTINAHKWYDIIDQNQKFTSEFVKEYLADPSIEQQYDHVKTGLHLTQSHYQKQHDSILLNHQDTKSQQTSLL